MTGGDVSEFMTEHPRELRLVVEVPHDPTGDVYVSAGNREGVDHRAVEDGEGEGEIGTLVYLCHFLPPGIEPGLYIFIRIKTVLGGNLRMGLTPHGNFLALAHEHELPLPGHRVHRATAKQRGSSQGGEIEKRRATCDDHVRFLSGSVRIRPAVRAASGIHPFE